MALILARSEGIHSDHSFPFETAYLPHQSLGSAENTVWEQVSIGGWAMENT